MATSDVFYLYTSFPEHRREMPSHKQLINFDGQSRNKSPMINTDKLTGWHNIKNNINNRCLKRNNQRRQN
jgi:hypothetical protein